MHKIAAKKLKNNQANTWQYRLKNAIASNIEKKIKLLNYFKLKILSTQKNSKLIKKYTTIWTKKSKVTSKNTLISTKDTRTTVKYRQKTENYHNKDQKIHYIL